MGLSNIKPANVDVNESRSFSPVPAGKYDAVCVSAVTEERSNAKGAYEVCKLRFQIVGGDHDGRLIFEDRIYVHSNTDFASRNVEFLSRLHACNGFTADDELNEDTLACNKLIAINVKIESQEGYDDRNKVTFVYPASSGAPSAPVNEPSSDDVAW